MLGFRPMLNERVTKPVDGEPDITTRFRPMLNERVTKPQNRS